MNEVRTSTQSPIALLAQRELQCLRAVAEFKRSSQIAFELQLSHKTVDGYIASACRKLGVSDRASAARLLIEHDRAIREKPVSAFSGVESGPRPGTASGVPRFPWPWPTRGRPDNDLTIVQLSIAIGIAAAIMMGVATIYIFAIALLSRGG